MNILKIKQGKNNCFISKIYELNNVPDQEGMFHIKILWRCPKHMYSLPEVYCLADKSGVKYDRVEVEWFVSPNRFH
jgi:hypothetical protein